MIIDRFPYPGAQAALSERDSVLFSTQLRDREQRTQIGHDARIATPSVGTKLDQRLAALVPKFAPA